VRPNDPHVHSHHKANAIGNGHAPDKAFLSALVNTIGGSILITKPAVANMALIKLAHARSYFKPANLMSARK
jgi:hypothetical protein